MFENVRSDTIMPPERRLLLEFPVSIFSDISMVDIVPVILWQLNLCTDTDT